MKIGYLIKPIFFSLIVVICNSHVAFSDTWKESNNCSITNNSAEFHDYNGTCLIWVEKGTLSSYGEFRGFINKDFLILSKLNLASKDVVFSATASTKEILSHPWLEQQNAKFRKSIEKTVEINLWQKRAKSYDVTTKDFGNGCFAFSSIGGSSMDDLSRPRFRFAAVACNQSGKVINQSERDRISSSFQINHDYYASPINGFQPKTKPKTSKTNQSVKTKIEKAETKCSELGFSSGTEKYGDCVMKILD